MLILVSSFCCIINLILVLLFVKTNFLSCFTFVVDDKNCILFVSGLVDPLLCAEPFVPLETFIQTDYNFSMDASEGLADLFDFL